MPGKYYLYQFASREKGNMTSINVTLFFSSSVHVLSFLNLSAFALRQLP